MARLVVSSGPLAGRVFDVKGELTIGREGATITLPDDEASRRHAIVRVADRRLVLEDERSLNGTWVDERRIDAPTPLLGGETIRVGSTLLKVEVEDEPPNRQGDASATAERMVPSAATAARPRPAMEPSPPPSPGSSAPSERAPERSAPEERRQMPNVHGGVPAQPPAPRAPSEPSYPTSPASAIAHRAPRFAAGEEQAAEPFGALAQTATRRPRRGIASRKLGPTFLSFATIIATACGLVAYFLERA